MQTPVSAFKLKSQIESLETYLKIVSLETTLFHDYVKIHKNIL